MSDEQVTLKEIFWPILITLFVFGGLIFVWFHSPMYHNEKENIKLQAQNYLRQNYWFLSQTEKAQLMNQYHLTNADIDPTQLFENITLEAAR